MNVLLLNGSARTNGSTVAALSEIRNRLERAGIDTTLFHIGNQKVHGCIGCGQCREIGHCVFQDDVLAPLLKEVNRADGIIIGSPVYYAGPSGALCAVLDRLFFSAGKLLRGKPAAAVAVCRRAGATAAIDRLNKYFTINQMPVVSSQYWNLCVSSTPEEIRQDIEGLRTMQTLAANFAAVLQNRSIRENLAD